MPDHVDVVKNEWLAGYQVLVARLFLQDGEIVIDSPEPDRWREALLRPRGDLDPVERPEEFLRELGGHLQGTYLLATELHDDDHCSFSNTAVLPMEADGGQPAQRAVPA